MGIGVYDIAENGYLSYIQTILSPSTMDNPWNSPDGSIYFAGLYGAWKAFTGGHPGSEIMKLEPDSYELTQTYMDNGAQFQGASIAVFWNENILVGSPFGNLMECHKLK